MPEVAVAVGGTFLQLTGAGMRGRQGGGLRGAVSGFSRQSRKRLLDLLNMVEQGALSSGLFLTLTYPDAFPEDPKRWKRDLDVFLKRMKREYPGAVAVWRLEWQPRLSGQNEGKVAPHFHIIALGIPRLSLRWLSVSWYETVGSGDERHLAAGTQAQRIRHRRGIMYYASKYMGKVAESPDFWTGRVWGVVGRDLLPVVLVTFVLDWSQFYKVRRVLRGWLERKRGKKSWCRFRGQGMTAYMDDATSGRVLAWASGM